MTIAILWTGDANSSYNHYQLYLGIHVVHAFISLFVLLLGL